MDALKGRFELCRIKVVDLDDLHTSIREAWDVLYLRLYEYMEVVSWS